MKLIKIIIALCFMFATTAFSESNEEEFKCKTFDNWLPKVEVHFVPYQIDDTPNIVSGQFFVKIVRLFGVTVDRYDNVELHKFNNVGLPDVLEYQDGRLESSYNPVTGAFTALLDHFDGYSNLEFELACEHTSSY